MMSLDIQKCRQCGATSDGPFCNAHCEQDYINARDAQEAHELRERHEAKLREAKLRREENTYRAKKEAGRRAQFASWGPK